MHLHPPRWPICALVLLTSSSAAAAPPLPECVGVATERFQSREFAAAAEAAGQCWQATQHPRAQFLIAMARLAQNHDAQALVALERYLGADLQGEPPRSVATARLKRDEARARTVAVTLQLAPPLAEGEQAEISATRDDDRSIVVPPIERDANGPLLRLDAGAWTVTVSRPGFVSATQAVQLAGDARERALEFAMQREQVDEPEPGPPPPPPPPVPKFPRGLWVATTVGNGAVVVISGLVALPVGIVATNRRLQISTEECSPGPALDRCRADFARQTGVRGGGAGALGAGLGLLTSGLTGLAPTARARRIGWGVEFAGGVVATAVGATLLALGLRKFNAVNTNNDDPALYWARPFQVEALGYSTQYTAGAGLLGAGIGLAIGAAAGLLVQSRVDGRGRAARLRLEPATGLRLRF